MGESVTYLSFGSLMGERGVSLAKTFYPKLYLTKSDRERRES